MTGEIIVAPDVDALQRSAVDIFAAAAEDAILARGRFRVALAGGQTPRAVYALLAGDAGIRARIDWRRVQFFWGDERHVPPDHADSNFGMARAAMLDRLPIGPDQVWRIKAELPSAAQAAREYEDDLRAAFQLHATQLPRFDLVLLGLGADGHTASLFPGTKALFERSRLVVANRVEHLGAARITLTAPVFSNAADIVFLVHGADKAPALRSVVEGPYRPERLPAQLIYPRRGRLRWLVDPPAARLLSPVPAMEFL